MIEKILERLREVGQLEISLHGGRCNGKTLTLGYKKGIENAIQIVQEVAKEYKDEYEIGFEDGAESVRALAPYEDGWIPCSERLPETDKNRKYLVCGKNGGIYIAEFVCKAASNNASIGPWWAANGRYAPEPIAWQPLPAPYQKGE